jgi:hypothetical protein
MILRDYSPLRWYKMGGRKDSGFLQNQKKCVEEFRAVYRSQFELEVVSSALPYFYDFSTLTSPWDKSGTMILLSDRSSDVPANVLFRVEPTVTDCASRGIARNRNNSPYVGYLEFSQVTIIQIHREDTILDERKRTISSTNTF